MDLPLHLSAFFRNPRFYHPDLVVLTQTDGPTSRRRRRQTTPRRSPILQLRDQTKGVNVFQVFSGTYSVTNNKYSNKKGETVEKCTQKTNRKLHFEVMLSFNTTCKLRKGCKQRPPVTRNIYQYKEQKKHWIKDINTSSFRFVKIH